VSFARYIYNKKLDGDYFENLDIEGRIILKCSLNE